MGEQTWSASGDLLKKKAGFSFKLILVIIAGIILLSTFNVFIVTIKPGYAGIVYNINGGLEDKVLQQGWHVIVPWKKVTAYPISTETVFMSKTPHEGRRTDDSLWVNTKDGKQVNVDVTFAYHMDIEKLPHVFVKFRGADANSIEWGFMKNELYRVLNNITSQYTTLDLIGEKRPEINARFVKEYKEILAPDGINMETCSLSRVEPDPQTVAVIQTVVNAQNALKQIELERQKAQIEAERKRIEAQGIADARVIEAEGQAKANDKLNQSLSANLIEYERVKKWDGKTPQTLVGNGSGTILQIK